MCGWCGAATGAAGSVVGVDASRGNYRYQNAHKCDNNDQTDDNGDSNNDGEETAIHFLFLVLPGTFRGDDMFFLRIGDF